MGTCDEIGTRIKILREKAGMTQADLAKEMHVSREAVNQWERGARDIKSGTIVALAHVLGTNCDYILRGIDTENIDAVQNYGLSNRTLQILKGLAEAAEEGEWDEEDELIAINGLLETNGAIGIIEYIYYYLVTDFTHPYIRKKSSTGIEVDKNSEDVLVKQDEYLVHFKGKQSDTSCCMVIDADLYESAWLNLITKKLRELKYLSTYTHIYD